MEVQFCEPPTLGELEKRIFRWLFETSDVIPWNEDPRMEPALLREWSMH